VRARDGEGGSLGRRSLERGLLTPTDRATTRAQRQGMSLAALSHSEAYLARRVRARSLRASAAVEHTATTVADHPTLCSHARARRAGRRSITLEGLLDPADLARWAGAAVDHAATAIADHAALRAGITRGAGSTLTATAAIGDLGATQLAFRARPARHHVTATVAEEAAVGADIFTVERLAPLALVRHTVEVRADLLGGALPALDDAAAAVTDGSAGRAHVVAAERLALGRGADVGLEPSTHLSGRA